MLFSGKEAHLAARTTTQSPQPAMERAGERAGDRGGKKAAAKTLVPTGRRAKRDDAVQRDIDQRLAAVRARGVELSAKISDLLTRLR